MKYAAAVIVCAGLATTIGTARADAGDLPTMLDLKRRGVPPRRFELSPFVGNLVGDRLHNALHVGARAEIRVFEELALGVEFGWSAISFATGSRFETMAKNENIYAIQGVVLLPLPAAMAIGSTAIVADLFGSVGGGVIRVGGFTRGDGFIGGGMKIHFGKLSWLALRVEVRSYFSSLPTPSGAEFTSDFAVMLGPTFLLPPVLAN